MSQRNDAFASGGLDALLQKSDGAKRYFSALPDYIQQMIEERGANIRSEDELHRYAANLMQGDK